MVHSAQQIVPSLYTTRRAANIFLLQDGATLTVIDTGMPGATKGILALVRELGHQPTDVEYILITHADIDHVGSLGVLAKVTGAQVYAGEETAQFIQKRISPPHIPAIARVIGGVIQAWLQQPADVDHIVNDGEILPIAGGLRVIATPGHTQDNVSYFWERERVLFCPDLLNNLDGLAPTQPRVTWDMDVAKRSIQKVLALDPEVICVGHGKPFYVKDTPGEIDNLRHRISESS